VTRVVAVLPRPAAPCLAVALALLSGCSHPGSAPTPAARSACGSALPAAPASPSTPVAILRDIAGGPSEYLIGSPGGKVLRLAAATGFSPPQLAAGSVYFSVRSGPATTSIWRGQPGGCARRIAEGTLGSVEPRGRALTALVGTRWVMLDAEGKQLAAVTGSAGTWTGDGRLVEPTVGGVDVFSLDGKKHSIAIPGISPLSPLGTHQELVTTATGVKLLDLDTGQVGPLDLGGDKALRAPVGSPDGTRVAFLDAAGVARVRELATGNTQVLTASSLSTGFTWSRDSRWVALQGVYGGVELNVTSGSQVDSNSLVVVSW